MARRLGQQGAVSSGRETTLVMHGLTDVSGVTTWGEEMGAIGSISDFAAVV